MIRCYRFGEIFVNHIYPTGLVSRLYKEISELNNDRFIQLKNGQNTCKNISPKSLASREIQVKNDCTPTE